MSDLFNESRQLIPFAIVAASLAGSLHCVSMCGPLVTASASRPREIASYHLGRLISYAGLGALAGAAGEKVLSDAASPWISLVSAALIAAALISLGIRSWKGRGLHVPLPRGLVALHQKLWRATAPSPSVQAGTAGLLSVFLPCGWLHVFTLAAVTTHSAAQGGALLALFWLGTVPALSFAPWGFRKVLQPLARKAPRFSAVLLISAGLATVGFRLEKAMARNTHSGHLPAASAEISPKEAASHSCH